MPNVHPIKNKGNRKVTSEKCSTASYNGIAIRGFFDVELVSGKEGSLTITVEKNVLPYMKVEVVDQILKISTEKNKSISTSQGKEIIIVVPFESISQVSLAGSGDVITKNIIISNSFSAKLTGSSDMNLSIEANDFDVNLSASGDIVLTGKTENFNSNLSGSGDIDAGDLKSKNAKITVSGSGNNKVFCSESIHARVSGSGDIKYTGDPKKQDTKANSLGCISRV